MKPDDLIMVFLALGLACALAGHATGGFLRVLLIVLAISAAFAALSMRLATVCHAGRPGVESNDGLYHQGKP